MFTHGRFFGIACCAAAFVSSLVSTPLRAQNRFSLSAGSLAGAALDAAPGPVAFVSEAYSSLSGKSIPGADPLGSAQPPPRRYGRVHYSDRSSNPDGSRKYTFAGGAGLTAPIGGTHSYLVPSYKFQVGGGRNFNKIWGVLIQFDYDHFGLQKAALNNLLSIYNNEIVAYNNANPGNQTPMLSQIDGTSHDWSFTLDPIANFYNGEKWGAYAIGGAGFYHKTANFSVPGVEPVNTGFGIAEVPVNNSLDKYTSNAFGVNGGFGFTLKPSRFANERIFAEARYVWTDNQPRPYSETGTTANPNYYNVFPQNSARTTYIPITFGLRF